MHTNIKQVVIVLFIITISVSTSVFAAPPSTKYLPGETIAPGCNPLTANCTVIPAAATGVNSDITSLTGLTTPLSFSQGGLGLSLLGNANQVLGVNGAGNALEYKTLDTSTVPENGNLYFTNTRADDRIAAQKGNANGIASLDGSGKIPLAQIPASLVGAVTYQGVWNASTNTPVLVSGVGTKGSYYVVSVAGTTTIDGKSNWDVGEWIIFNGSTWDEVQSADSVSSVNGHVGTVVLNKSDIGLGNVENTTLSTWAGSSSLNTLGTIGTGTWNGTAIDVTHGGTGLSSIAANSLLYSPSSNTIGALAAGSNGQVLKMVSGVPAWGTDNTGSTSFTAGTGINGASLSSNTIAVDESALTLNNIGGTLSVAKGGTGQASLAALLTALLPIQTSNAGKFLTTDGSGTVSWGTPSAGAATWGSITGTLANQTDLNNALSGKEPSISAGSTSQYWRGDKTWQTLDKGAVGLGNVENTALSTWAGSSNITTIGTLTSAVISGTTTTGHLKGGGSTPGIAAGAGAGSSPTISIVGTDTAGQITLTSGTLPTVSATIATVTFATAYGTAPYIMLTPANALTAALSGATAAYAATASTANFTIASGTGGITAVTTYKWNYFVVQ